jgi:hypothetical protein
MDEKLDLRRLPQSLEQDPGSEHVGQDELARVDDRPVDMGLGREVDDTLHMLEDPGDELGVPDVAVDKLVTDVAFEVGHILRIARIGQLVEVDDPNVLVFGQYHPDEVAADESRPAGDQDRLPVQGTIRRAGRGRGDPDLFFLFIPDRFLGRHRRLPPGIF